MTGRIAPDDERLNHQDHQQPTAPIRDVEAVDAVVIGSGFGGSVAAARLAQAGLEVVVLERGRRWRAGSFPRNEDDLKDGWLWSSGRGLYELRWLDRMISVQGAGWGGGSLIYANVFARPPAEVFDQWPARYTRPSMDHYYDLAAHMLEVTPAAADPVTGRLPLRTLAMRQVVADLGRPAGTVNPQLAVRIRNEPDELLANLHGARQRGCAFIGECVLGCNRGAKNSLDYNYLHVAERHGAQARADCEVTGISAVDDGYRITYRDHEAREERAVTARSVFFGAGAVGTTELLLRARDAERALPHLSGTLGSGFSGNGDFLAFVRRARTALDPGHGPTITTTSIVDCEIRGRKVWFQVQDGSYPERLGLLIQGLNPAKGALRRLKPAVALLASRAGRHASRTSGPRRGDNKMTLLLMGRDTSNGRLSLDHHGEARVAWNNAANRDLYRAEGRVSRQIARQLGGRAGFAPSWSLLRQAVTVHNLGGVPMGATVREGVVNERGEVHGYPGLFVVDGAVIPAATGVNPSATILAVAERIVEGAIRGMTGDEGWSAPETASVQTREVPEDEAMAAMAEARTARLGGGVRFSEKLAGSVLLPDGPTPLILELTVSTAGLAALEADPRHEMSVHGAVTMGDEPSCAITGTLALFPARTDTAMEYDLHFVDADGELWSLRGTKHHNSSNVLRVWRDLTTITFELANEHGDRHHGTAHITFLEAVRLALSVEGIAYSRLSRSFAVLRFARTFARNALVGRRKESAITS